MIMLHDYDIFVDERISKNSKTYYGLFIKVGDLEHLISFINKYEYDKIKSLSE